MSARPTHPLETWAREAFGGDFASMILHGLSDEVGDSGFLMTVEDVDRVGRKGRKTLAMKNREPEPWGLKPLVLAALLKLLVERPEFDKQLDYSFPEVLTELGWPDVPASRRVVHDSVVCYIGCEYLMTAVYEGGAGRCNSHDRLELIYGCHFSYAGTTQCDQFGDEGSIRFDPELVEGLRRGRVVFAGIDFGEFGGGSASGVEFRQAAGGARTTPPAVDRTFLPAGPRPALKFEVTPVSRRSADPRSKLKARAVGETTISFDTGALASVILRALNRVAAKHKVPHECPGERSESFAEYVHREVDRLLRKEAYKLVRELRRRVFDDVIFRSFGLLHSMIPKERKNRKGPRPVWHSGEHLVSSLERAIEAIEFEREWKPKTKVELNLRWRLGNVHTATVKLIAAYWEEADGKMLGKIDQSKMDRWLKSFGMPSFSEVRRLLRLRIAKRREIEVEFQAFGGSFFHFVVFHSDLFDN